MESVSSIELFIRCFHFWINNSNIENMNRNVKHGVHKANNRVRVRIGAFET